MQDTTHSIFHSAKRFFSGTMLSRISGMLRDMAMAYAFGTHEAIAAFMVAFRFSHLLRRLFGEGALQTAFIPYFETLRSESPDRANQFFKDLTRTLSLGLIAIILFSMGILYICLQGIDFSSGNREILFLTLLMLPSLLFICLFGLNASLLQCEKSYFTPGVAPVAFNLIWIIGVCLLGSLPETSAMRWLAICVIVACLGQWLITVPRVRNLTSAEQPHSLFSSDVKKLWKPLSLGILGVAAAQINSAFDAIFARYADVEGPALLWYALRIQQLPLALFGIAIAGALLPPLTRALKAQNISTYRIFLEFALRRSFALMLPISMALLVMGGACINLIYGHGDFTDSSVAGTTLCLWGYGAGLVPMTFVLVLAPAFYARGDYRTPTIASTTSMLLNIALNALMIGVFVVGAWGVAFATSISAAVNCAILIWKLRDDLQTKFFAGLGKVVVASTGASAAVLGLDSAFFGGHALRLWSGDSVAFPRQLMDQLWQCGAEGILFLAVLFTIAWMMKTPDLIDLFTPRKVQVE